MNPLLAVSLLAVSLYEIGSRFGNLQTYRLRKTKTTLLGIVSLLATSSTMPTSDSIAQSTSSEHKLGSIVREWNFGQIDDIQSDQWPDDWTRRTGVGFPKYTRIGLTRETTNKEALHEIENLRRTLSQIWIGWQQRQFPWTITPESTPEAIDFWLERTLLNPFLRMELDGASAEVQSPLVPISQNLDFSLKFSTRFPPSVDASYRIGATIRLLDSNRKIIAEEQTIAPNYAATPTLQAPASHNVDSPEYVPLAMSEYVPMDSWLHHEVFITAPLDKQVAFAQVVLHVNPKTRLASQAIVDFDNVQICRFPKLELRQQSEFGIYTIDEPIVLDGTVFTVPSVQGFAKLTVRDHTDTVLVHERYESNSSTTERTGDSPQASRTDSQSFSSNLTGLSPGYYEARLEYFPNANAKSSKVQTFVVIGPGTLTRNDRYGVALGELTGPQALRWVDTMTQLGFSNLKFPVFGPVSGSLNTTEITDRLEDLQRNRWRVVGIIDPYFQRDESDLPTSSATQSDSNLPSVPRSSSNENRLNASRIESPTDSERVQQETREELQLRSIASRLNILQFGLDTDTQLRRSTAIASRIDKIQSIIEVNNIASQFAHVVDPTESQIASDSITQPKASVRKNIFQHSTTIPFTASETRKLIHSATTYPVWYSIAPVSKSHYASAVRIDDLLQRMLLTTEPDFPRDAIGWLADPFHIEHGVFTPSGTPAEMFLPVRNIGQKIQRTTKIGSFSEPNFPANVLLYRPPFGDEPAKSSGSFLQDSDVATPSINAESSRADLGVTTLVLMGSKSQTIQMYLGPQIKIQDVWGREIEHTSVSTTYGLMQEFNKGESPLFIEGIDLKAAKWRMGMQLLTDSIPIQTEKASTIQVGFSNLEPYAIHGEIELESPSFAMKPPKINFTVPAASDGSFSPDAVDATDVSSVSPSNPNTSNASVPHAASNASIATIDVPVQLSPFADSGLQPVRITARVEHAGEITYVSTERQIQVGDPTLRSEVAYDLDSAGNLILMVSLASMDGALGNLDCYVSAPGRTRKRARISSPGTESTIQFLLPDGQELFGQTIWVQVEQLDKGRIHNQRSQIEHLE